MKKYVLTQEGDDYARHGLPELALVKALDKPRPISELKSMPNFSIALQWAKKNGWIEIEAGLVKKAGNAGHYELQDAIISLSKGKAVQERLLDILIQRKLVEPEKESKTEVALGQEVSEQTEALIKSGSWKRVSFKPYNVEAPGKRIYPGKRQPYSKFLSDVRKRLVEMGFVELRGSTIVTEFWNFDALFQPQNHPSRDWTQTYSLKYPKEGRLPDKKIVEHVAAAHENGWRTGSTGWGYKWNPKKAMQLMPVAHDTAVSPRALASRDIQIPGKYFQIVRCFRPDVIDATHLVEFNQMGGFVVADDLNFKDLLGLLKTFALDFGEATRIRFLPDYYPFTEPSVQMNALHPVLGWVELGGAGIFREELTKPLGIEQPVIAWGIGIDRVAMYKLAMNDVRDMFSHDLEWLRNRVVN